MKKLLILTAVFTLILPTVQANAMLGDIDNDGELTAGDAAITLQYTLNPSIVNGSDYSIDNMKVTKNDGITAENAAAILQKSLNKSYRFPVTYITLDEDGKASLIRVMNSINNYVLPSTSGTQHQILQMVYDEMYAYYLDENYDIQSGIAKAKELKETMSQDEKNELKDFIIASCNTDDLTKLYDIFSFLVG
jgi:hypothetical protein